MNKQTVLNKLQLIIDDIDTTEMTKEVANNIYDLLQDYEEPKAFFKDFWVMGCKSGIIPGQIYYKDTYEFFDRHSEEILEMLQTEMENGLDIKPEMVSKNDLSWFGFEQKVSDIQLELFKEEE